MKLPTFADPESLSHVYNLLQNSFHQMNNPNNNSAGSTNIRKRRRKNEGGGGDDGDEDDDKGSVSINNGENKKHKKEELKGILTSILLLDEQEKQEIDNSRRVSEDEKFSLETNHKKKTKAMSEYFSNLDDCFSQVEESERVKRKNSRNMSNSVVFAAACSESFEEESSERGNETTGSKSGGSQRRLWVKDRSKAWWDECNKDDFPEDEFKKAFRMGKSTFDLICEELNSAIVKEDTTLRNAIPVRQRVAVCLWRLATGDPLRIVSKRFGLGISTCHKLVLEVCTAIKTVLMPKYLQWPNEASLR
ncbi:hypothetical protein KIW84_060632, partial [Lathyrus oleraceus]